MKICPVGAELFHADGQTGIMKLTVPFCNFVNTPNNEVKYGTQSAQNWFENLVILFPGSLTLLSKGYQRPSVYINTTRIQTRCLTNTSPDHYHCTNLVG